MKKRKIQSARKDKTISLRLTEDEYNKLKTYSKKNNMTLSTYMLNQSLNENQGIYTKQFFETVMRIHNVINTIQTENSNMTDIKSEAVDNLTQEVHNLWQYLK